MARSISVLASPFNSASCAYLLPIRRAVFSPAEAVEFAEYFQVLGKAGCDVFVINGSPGLVWEQYRQALSPFCRHERVDSSFGYLNDKVNAIHTGVSLASSEKIILADDDIRYAPPQIDRVAELLDEFEVVRPQNFLSPLPWWARMEAARMLINRATLRIADYPGTCAFRRATMLRVGHYDGDVLFDNEEIIRHFAREKAAILYATDLFVHKRPPSLKKWIEQRPRQAYEDFGLRAKTALFFSIPPIAMLFALAFGWKGIVLFVSALSLMAIALAAAGRRRGTAAQFFPWPVCLFAPLWMAERALSTYWALYWRLTRGGYPFGDKILSKGIGRDWVSGGKIASASVARQSNE